MSDVDLSDTEAETVDDEVIGEGDDVQPETLQRMGLQWQQASPRSHV